MIEFRLLGPVRVVVDGVEDPLGGTKPRTVLAALLLADGRAVSDGHLSSLLWDWHPPATAQAQMYTYVSRLRRRFGDALPILRLSGGYRMSVDGLWRDHAEFARLARTGLGALGAGRFAQAAAELQAARGLWRGAPVSDATDYLIDSARPHLDELHMAVLEGAMEADLALGRHRQLVGELTELVRENPLWERLRAHLMIAMYRCGRQADAMALFHAGRRVLADELGVSPGAALTQAYQTILTASAEHTLTPVRAAAPVAPSLGWPGDLARTAVAV
ncbi:MAG TPA: AfsR/SARP family transcriptional regulator [Rugosimonospora sp.]|nr:AfsR/SARP family transcriptional regulator [Rugosimonospora sp.]